MSGILDAITNLFSGSFSQLTENLIVLGLGIFTLVLGFFGIRYLGRRRQLLNQERMAAMIKGLHYAGVARDVFARPQADARDHVLRGIRWLFAAGGISGALYGYERLQPDPDMLTALRGLLAGVVPALIGLAHLLFSWLTRRRNSAVQPTVRGSYRAVS